MKKIIILLLFITNANALKPHNAKYTLSYNNIHIGNSERVLQKNNHNGYFYQDKSESTGLLSIFKKYTIDATSHFAIRNNRLDSKQYNITKKNNNKIDEKTQLIIHSPSKQVTNTINGKNNYKTTRNNIIDELILPLAIQFDVMHNTNKKEFNYQIATGKKIKHRLYINQGKQTIKINNQTMEVVKLTQTNKDKTRTNKIYLDPKNNYTPVQIQQNDKGKQYTYTLVNINFN